MYFSIIIIDYSQQVHVTISCRVDLVNEPGASVENLPIVIYNHKSIIEFILLWIIKLVIN